jgi:hypothetical protein
MQTRDEDSVAKRLGEKPDTGSVLLVVQPCLQREGLAAATAPSRARQGAHQHLPLDQGEPITTIVPLPEDEKTWGNST